MEMSERTCTGSSLGRRSFLSLGAVSLAGASGCVQRARNVAARDSSEQVSLSLKTTPADDDPYAIRLAQRLAGHLADVGVDVEVVPMRNDQLLRDVLLNQSFDLYVAAHPGGADPDFLYPLLHSRYAAEHGWQNPFGYSDLSTDELLDRQRRRTGGARRQAVSALQRVVARKQPFAVIAAPDAIRAVRGERFRGWSPEELRSPAQYLTLRRSESEAATASSETTGERPVEERGTLRVGLTDGRATENLNPIAVTFRSRGTVMGLLYDPLALPHRGRLVPWLAESWQWDRRGTEPGPVATVRLREDLTWHDGRPITADDVAFTFRFLADTSLQGAERAVPAPRFRGAESLVAGTERLDARTIRFEFAAVHPDVAVRALAVPMLPRHEWRPRSEPANLAGLDLFEGSTEALVWPNMEPVGSGPLTFQRAVTDETLILDRFEDHFAWGDPPGVPDDLAGRPAFDRLAFRIVPSDGAVVELLAAGELDATGGIVHAGAVPAAVRSDDVRLVVRQSRSFYHVGFNTRRGPLSNPHFRRAVSRLIDKERAVNDVFGGFATPLASPVVGSDWLAPSLGWEGRDPVLPFAGNAGRLDVDRARELFERAGYRYDGEGRLLRR